MKLPSADQKRMPDCEDPIESAAAWACARLLERANALGAVKPEHFILPHAKYREKTAGPRGTGYDPNRPQKTWRTAWRALVKATAREAGRASAKEALEAGRGLRAAIVAFKRAAAELAGLRFHDLRHWRSQNSPSPRHPTQQLWPSADIWTGR